MLILIKQGEEETILAAGAQRALNQAMGPENASMSGSVAHQVRETLRGTSIKVDNRGNDRSALGWTSHYEFESLVESEYFWATHAADVQRTDELRVVVANPAGGTEIISVPNTVITDVTPVLMGVTVSVTYAAIGGKAERIET